MLVFKEVHKVIKFNQNASLKLYKYFFKSMNNAVFHRRKNYENIRRHRGIKLVTTERSRNYLVLELNYHTTKFFTENLLAIEIEKQRYL